jgi:hypothetical protein
MTFNIDAPRVIVMKQARGGLQTAPGAAETAEIAA